MYASVAYLAAPFVGEGFCNGADMSATLVDSGRLAEASIRWGQPTHRRCPLVRLLLLMLAFVPLALAVACSSEDTQKAKEAVGTSVAGVLTPASTQIAGPCALIGTLAVPELAGHERSNANSAHDDNQPQDRRAAVGGMDTRGLSSHTTFSSLKEHFACVPSDNLG